ncbi:sodium:solute symporter family protein [Tissierella sp.]|uniref:sodium:solute symporter family protein n=1 Tax=Tissierella sp. TaxID=41274 RepID=UPI00285A96C3|nr:sodium:solute symporter family protein [Tissierella sp.]MDR7857618.1 sodium:solute symporter family protein [Tissierella sp.]
MNVQVIFTIFFIVFAAIMVGAGMYSKKWVSDTSDYILAGREVSLLINIMGVAAIGFAGTTVSLAPGYSILYGIKGSLIWGVIYSALGLIFYGLVFSKFIRTNGAQTLPEYLEMRYDGKVRNVVAVGTIIGLCGILANNIMSVVGIVSGFVGWPQGIVLAIVFAIILVFTYISGLWAATITDFFQVSVGIIAVPLFLTMAVKRFGGIDFLQANWGGANVFTEGITGGSMGIMSLKYPSALTFILLFGAALVWGNNYYWMKIASCRNEKIAKQSFGIAGLLLITVFMIPLAFIGAYAGAVMPEAYTLAGGTSLPTAAYGVFASLFPPVVSSFFIIGSVAASISTASTAAIGASSTATRDIYQRIINPKADGKTTLKASKIIMLLVGILTWALCYFPGGPTYLFAFANAWLVPPAVLLCFGAIWPKFNSNGALWGVLAGMVSMAALTLTELLGIFSVGKWTHLAIIGFLVTVIVGLITTKLKPSKYYAQSDWKIKVSEGKRENVTLDKMDIQVLELIRNGHIYMADITDALGVDSKASNSAIEKLDRGGYIERAGLVGSKFYEFYVTKKANEVLPQLTGQQAEMNKVGLNTSYVGLLKIANDAPQNVNSYVKDQQWKSLKVSSVTSHLTRQGYIIEKGLFKRKIKVTQKGIEAIKKYA